MAKLRPVLIGMIAFVLAMALFTLVSLQGRTEVSAHNRRDAPSIALDIHVDFGASELALLLLNGKLPENIKPADNAAIVVTNRIQLRDDSNRSCREC